MAQQPAIVVAHASKRFILPHERVRSIKQAFVHLLRRHRTARTDVQHVLQDINFEIASGQFVGIVGRNGSGKSTLLKMMAEIYRPSAGSITINGKLVPFIELGVGFNPELSGRENVYLNGALLGFSVKEVDAFYQDIVDFAELERFMDQKLKNYSSGMQVRLAFSVAIVAQADILLVDEVLAVGDADFQRKCFDYSSPKNLEFMTRHLPTSIARADLIVAVSNHAKQTLCEKFSVDPAKVIVSHLAAEPTLYYRRSDHDIARAKAKYGIFGPYMLFVSTMEPRKNVENLVKAYQKLPQKLKDTYSLVLVGGHGWRDEPIREAIAQARMQGDRVVLPGYVATEDMAALYSGATAFMFPSHYEGFGLPVLEAMRCGTPVLTADNTALPESAGDAALYVDSTKFSQLQEGMHELLTNEKLRKDLIKKGYKQADSFSWEKCASTIYEGMQAHKLV